MDFNPMAFVDNLKWMGIGMLGVFMIVAIIMGFTYLINYLANRAAELKEQGSENDEQQ